MTAKSAIYTGRVVHRRFRPREHRLSYACYWLLLDLDEVDTLARRLRHFSYNRFNLFSLRDCDHGDGSARPLRRQIAKTLENAGIQAAESKVFLLTMPRVLWFCFNPLSLYYVFGRDGALIAIVYEVHNTFRQRHSYVVKISDRPQTAVSHDTKKVFYVSPFLEMDLRYGFKTIAPEDSVHVTVTASDSVGKKLKASLAGRAEPLTDKALRRLFLLSPLISVKVVAAIHFEALKLWWKGIQLVPRPAPPNSAATVIKVPTSRPQETS